MILDEIARAEAYRGLGPGIAMALDYLARTDFTKLADGRYGLEGERVFALVQRYVPRKLAEAKWEAHRKYVDVQYVVQGAERMGYLWWTPGLSVSQAYDAPKDVIFYAAQGGMWLDVRAGQFVIFGPRDVHAPGIHLFESSVAESFGQVLKVVVKVAVEMTQLS